MSKSVVATDRDISNIRNPLDLDKLESIFKLSKEKIEANSKIHLGPDTKWPFLSLPVRVKQFKYGQSNPTYYLVDSKGQKFTLRRKPAPNAKLLSKKAHTIEREFWINYDVENLNLKRGFLVPIARSYVLCEDESYLGVVFYVAKFVEGHIFHDPGMPTLKPDEKLKCWKNVIEKLYQIHQLPTNELSHSFPKRPASSSGKKGTKKNTYFQRQVKALGAIQKLQTSPPKTKKIYGFDEISKYLVENSPPDASLPILIHGDFKIDNFIFDLNTFKVIAILDWELSTIGSPVFDLANLLQNYYSPREFNQSFLETDLNPDEGFVYQILKYYADVIIGDSSPKDSGNLKNWLLDSGSDYKFNENGSNTVFKYWNYGKAFACYRLAVIIQGIHSRVINGLNSSGKAHRFLNTFDSYSRLALDFIDSHKSKAKL